MERRILSTVECHVMKTRGFIFLIFLLTAFVRPGFGQQELLESLKHEIANSSNDTLRYVLLDSLSTKYQELSPDSAYYYSARAVELARKLGYKLHEAVSLGKMGYAQTNLGNYPRSLQLLLQALDIANDPQNEESMLPLNYRNRLWGFSSMRPLRYQAEVQSFLHFFLSILYENINQYDKELAQLNMALRTLEEGRDSAELSNVYYVLGRVYLAKQMPDSTITYEQKSIDFMPSHGETDSSGSYLTIGKAYLAMGKIEMAANYLRTAYLLSENIPYPRGQIAADLLLSEISLRKNDHDSASYFSNHALGIAQKLKVPDLMLRTYTSLSAVYTAKKKYDSASKYQALIIKLKDSVFNSKQLQQFQNIEADQLKLQQDLENARKDYHTRSRTYGLIIGIVITLLVSMLLWRNIVLQQRAFGLLKKQKQETDFQKTRVEETLEELKATQAQLVQREKMASLGELTAGVAHEIQNPLNFVKNFSEVNTELGTELNEALEKGNIEHARKISQDILQNLGKITHHGQRADGIVKGMMLYSLAREGKKEFTNIENLVIEYLRITYSGFQSGHEGFHAKIETNFDPRLGEIEVIPQDIGRVLSNLFNNAFYSLNEKLKKHPPPLKGEEEYQPRLVITTKYNNSPLVAGGVEIRIHDNGYGIPEKSIGKIFQPFFTLKPTGQGTGLGLSISYDIINREHGGIIEAFSQEGEYAEFVIRLPVG